MPLPSSIKVVSSGGVVFRKSRQGIEVCLILRSRKVWCLPKGHVERGERLSETACREIREETGLSARSLGKLGAIRYSFVEKNVKHLKRAHFFLCEYLSGRPHGCDYEVLGARWFSAERALQRMTFESERKILEKALGMIRKDCRP